MIDDHGSNFVAYQGQPACGKLSLLCEGLSFSRHLLAQKQVRALLRHRHLRHHPS